MTTTAQKAQYSKALVSIVYFVELRFRSGTQYVCSWNYSITWGGHDWLGLGTIGDISAAEESETVEPKSLTFGLSSPSSYLYLAVGDVEEYRGRQVIVYIAPLDDNGAVIDTPEVCWRGVMEDMSVSANGNDGKIDLKAENAMAALARKKVLRMNSAQQKYFYPSDTSFDYLPDLISKPQQWLSRRFQEV